MDKRKVQPQGNADVPVEIVDLAGRAAEAMASTSAGAVWSLGSADLNLNLLHFEAGDGVPAHVNAELDVVGVVIAGEGTLEVADEVHVLRAGMLFFLPKGLRRAITASTDDFAYLTCHRRRPGLMPKRGSRPSALPS